MNRRIPRADTRDAPDWWSFEKAIADGGWNVFDPNARQPVAPVKVVDGEYEIQIASYAPSGLLITGGAAGVTLWRDVFHDGAVADVSRQWTARLSVFDVSGIQRRTAADSLVIVCGYMNGPPSGGTATKILKGVGIERKATNPAGTLTGTCGSTAGDTTWASASDLGAGRMMQITVPRHGRKQRASLCPAMCANGWGVDQSLTTYTNTTSAEAGTGSRIVEFIHIGRIAAGTGTTKLRLRAAGGTLVPYTHEPRYAPMMRGDLVDVLIDGDSTHIGDPPTDPNAVGSCPLVITAIDRFLMRETRRAIQAFRWIGGTLQSAAVSQYFPSGAQYLSPSNGKKITDLVAAIPTANAVFVAQGFAPKIAICNAGYQDAEAGDSAATMRANYEAWAAGWHAIDPTIRCMVVAQPPKIAGATGKATHDAAMLALLAAAPAGFERVIDCYTGWTDAYRLSGANGHPRAPASPGVSSTWDVMAMDAAAAANSQNGFAAIGHEYVKALTGRLPILNAGEVRPFGR